MGLDVFTAAVIALMLVVPALVRLRRPSNVEIARVWSPVGKLVSELFDLSAALSLWWLLPYASEPLRLLMVVFYAAVISSSNIAKGRGTATDSGSAWRVSAASPSCSTAKLAIDGAAQVRASSSSCRSDMNRSTGFVEPHAREPGSG